ncbi:YqeG family HAD IIIA-type phosphatase [Geobacter sp. AOG2]|uniref:YqeG family HAD IIIA-type phosphatase n=1 Tax=Geobacter sp. AOG2 TaxID=1566347 RepID=UPI001CC6646C|nr:HAD family hydrolase [Geobacter sp. AOG2]GFE60257.1 haloacid dehalogenase [Geobacter sp. AOG2]
MPPLAHVLAGFTLGFTFRKELGRVLRETRPDSSIASLDPARLAADGIAALALDFDGVLAPHGFPAPLPEAREWLTRCSAVFGADRIFILSNKPTEARKAWFGEHFPGIRFISGVRKKPYPDGLQKVQELAHVPLSAILMVDDRLLTGCLAALNTGARPLYIRRPYRSFRHRPLAELFFALLRAGERFFL